MNTTGSNCPSDPNGSPCLDSGGNFYAGCTEPSPPAANGTAPAQMVPEEQRK